MSDPIAAILAVPPAIDACKNLIRSLRDNLSHESHKTQAEAALDKVGSIQVSIYQFTDFTETVRKWKEVHFTTQLLLYNDLPDTLAMVKKGPDGFVRSASSNRKKIQGEFRQLFSGRTGSIIYIDTMKKDDFITENIPAELFNPDEITWGQHIKNLAQCASAFLSANDIGSTYNALLELERACTLLNITADKRIEEGLLEITKVMSELRNSTRPQV